MQPVCICAGASPGSSQVWHLLTEAAESLIYWLTSNTRPPRFRLWAQMSYRIRMRIKARVHLALLLWREGGFLWGFPWSQPLPPSAAAPTPIPYPCVCVLTALPDLFHYWTLSLTYFLITSAGVTPIKTAGKWHKKGKSEPVFVPFDEYFLSEWEWLKSLEQSTELNGALSHLSSPGCSHGEEIIQIWKDYDSSATFFSQHEIIITFPL